MAASTALTAVGCLVVKELSSQAFTMTISHLSDVMSFMGRRPDDVTRALHRELVGIVPTAKLKIIQSILIDFDGLRHESKTIDTLAERLTELAQSINYHTQQIGIALEHFNQLYFRGWRTLDVSDHLTAIQRDSKSLEETFDLLRGLLPSCLAIVHTRKPFPPPSPLKTIECTSKPANNIDSWIDVPNKISKD